MISFFFATEVQMFHIFIIHLPVDEHLGGFQFLANVNVVTIITDEQVSVE